MDIYFCIYTAMKRAWRIVLWIIVVVGLSVVGFYNGMVQLEEEIKSVEAQVDNMYERRKDLVPQVAAVVKKYAEYEQGTLSGIVALRSQNQNLQTLNEMAAKGDVKSSEFSSLLASTMGGLKITLEAYPELKADTQFTNLYTTLEGSENRIRTAIKDYNDRIVPYNLKVRSFPWGKIFSWLFGFEQRDRITPPDDKEIKEVPNVEELLK